MAQATGRTLAGTFGRHVYTVKLISSDSTNGTFLHQGLCNRPNTDFHKAKFLLVQ